MTLQSQIHYKTKEQAILAFPKRAMVKVLKGVGLRTMTKASNNRILTEAHHDFFRGLSRYANLKINDAALSDDLVQATFLKTWLYLQKTGKIELMRAFLYHVLNNLIVDEYRKKKALSLDLLGENGFELKAANSENIFNIINI
jgi:DNA-directed RNA polymerase specialized sigma24 family protein